MPWKGESLSIGALLGNLEGIRMPGLSERRVPFLDPEDIEIFSLGAIWNLGKGTGLS